MAAETRLGFSFQGDRDRDNFVLLAKRVPGISIVKPVAGGCVVRIMTGSQTLGWGSLGSLANEHRGRLGGLGTNP